MADARPVMIEDRAQKGNGFLFTHRGVCYVILPSHLHGRAPFSVTARDPSGQGIGRIIHKADASLDLSLGVVSGSLSQNCGQRWETLPRSFSLADGHPVSVVRYQEGSVETLRANVTSMQFTHFEIAPTPEEPRFFAAATSGSFVFDGDRPLGMIVEATDRQTAWVVRWDEIHDRLRRVVEDWYQDDCTDAAGCAATLPDLAPPTLSGFRLTAWQPQPIAAENGADAMIAGQAPFIAAITRAQPVTLTFEADEIKEISRVLLVSDADGSASVSPKLVTVMIDTSSDGIERWRNFRSPKDMVPGQPLDLQRSPTLARRLQIRIGSGWGKARFASTA